jgi:hypothetical protein
LRGLERPFKYRGIFLPVLPFTEEFLPILDSPAPFVCGIVKTGQLPPIPEHLVVVELDHDEINDPDHTPLLPDGERLIQKLQGILDLNRREIELPPKVLRDGATAGPNPDFLPFVKSRRTAFINPMAHIIPAMKYIFGQEVVDQIRVLFRVQIEPGLELLLRPCLITDTTDPDRPVTVFNKDLFLESVSPVNRPFYSAFMLTTMFHVYCDGLMDETARQAGSTSKNLSKYQSLPEPWLSPLTTWTKPQSTSATSPSSPIAEDV